MLDICNFLKNDTRIHVVVALLAWHICDLNFPQNPDSHQIEIPLPDATQNPQFTQYKATTHQK